MTVLCTNRDKLVSRRQEKDLHYYSPTASPKAVANGHNFNSDTFAPIGTKCHLRSVSNDSTDMLSNSKKRSKSIPIKAINSTTSPSSLSTKTTTTSLKVQQMNEEAELADYRDYVMFSRIVNGMSRQQVKNYKLRQQNNLCLAHIIGTRNGYGDSYHENREKAVNDDYYYYWMNRQQSYDDMMSSHTNRYNTNLNNNNNCNYTDSMNEKLSLTKFLDESLHHMEEDEIFAMDDL